jgi:hypothetical protein
MEHAGMAKRSADLVQDEHDDESPADAYEAEMRRRRWRRRLWVSVIVLVLFFIGAVAVLPTTRYGILGLLRGEHFFRGMPTSYWRREVVQGLSGHAPSMIDRWVANVERRLGLNPRAEAAPDAALKEGDPAAVPVLVDLLADKHEGVRVLACTGLTTVGEGGRDDPAKLAALTPALPALVALLRDGSKQDQYYVSLALAEVGPEAKEAVPILAKYLRGERHELFRTVYARALLSIAPDHDAALPRLVLGLNSTDSSVRSETTLALTRLLDARGEAGRAALRARRDEVVPALRACEQLEIKDNFAQSATARRCQELLRQLGEAR